MIVLKWNTFYISATFFKVSSGIIINSEELFSKLSRAFFTPNFKNLNMYST